MALTSSRISGKYFLPKGVHIEVDEAVASSLASAVWHFELIGEHCRVFFQEIARHDDNLYMGMLEHGCYHDVLTCDDATQG